MNTKGTNPVSFGSHTAKTPSEKNRKRKHKYDIGYTVVYCMIFK